MDNHSSRYALQNASSKRFFFLFSLKKKTTSWSKVGKILHVTSPPFKTDSISLLFERDSGKAASVYLLIFPKLI